jgi:glycosyltransferase involved in cell wall biosynthesis
MRAGLVIYDALDTVSGGYLYDRRLVDYLRRQGDSVEIISLPGRRYGRCLTDNLAADLPARLAGDFDVLLQDELCHPSLAWANGLFARRAPVVAIVHHLRWCEARPRWQNALYRSVERRYLRSVDGFIFNSQTTQRAVESLVGGGRPRVVATPGGDRLAAPAADEPERWDGPLRLLFAGNLIRRKGLHTLLAALAVLPVEWRLRVAGRAADPAYAWRMAARAARPPLAGRVAWCGPLSDAALAAEMAAAHLMVVPSDYEGFGIVYLEGMAFGLPAIATTGGAAAELISDGVNGYLIAPGDTAALAERLLTLANDRARLAQMSAAARARFARWPAWDDSCAAIRAFLIDITRQNAYQ